MTDPVQLSHSQVQITQLFEDKPTDPHATAAATESPHRSRHGSAVSTKSTESKAKAAFLSPEHAMKQYMSKLSTFEHHEVFSYPEGKSSPRLGATAATGPSPTSPLSSVYFVGPSAKKRLGIMGGANNGGYDDDQGSYIHVPHDHIAYRYEVLKVIGKGSFGQVRGRRRSLGCGHAPI